MKKIFAIVFLIFTLFLITVPAQAKDYNITFQWDQSDLTNVSHWNLYWRTEDGSYVKGFPLISIIRDNPVDGSTNTFQSDVITQIEIPQGTTSRRYFVLTAATANNAVESEFSNEVFKDFVSDMTAPFNFTITIKVN